MLNMLTQRLFLGKKELVCLLCDLGLPFPVLSYHVFLAVLVHMKFGTKCMPIFFIRLGERLDTSALSYIILL